MKRKTKAWILIVALIIILSNFLPINYFSDTRYTYQNKDGSFKYTEESAKGLDLEVGKIRFDRFKTQHPENLNKTLYRTFCFKYWKFWDWLSYLWNYSRFTVPYLKVMKATSSSCILR